MELLESKAYWVSSPGVGELKDESVSAQPATGQSLIRAEWSAVSSGTERLVGLGLVSPACNEPMACRYMAGSFALPLKYGYCLIGQGLEGELAGRSIFVMHPHQSLALVRDEDATVLPSDLFTRRAALIPNLETALNAVWDAELSAGETCTVFGAGSVGLLVAYVLWKTTGTAPRLADVDEERRAFAGTLPWGGGACAPLELEAGTANVAFHTTGNPLGLQLSLNHLGFEGRVIELSWYGDKAVSLELGTHFHFGRKRIIASQVGTIAVNQRAVHDYKSRIREVLALLDEPALDRLLGDPVPFARMPEFMDSLYRGDSKTPLPLIRYGAP